MTTGPGDPANLGWFLADFIRRIPDAAHALVVSADGLLLATSGTLPRELAEQVSAVASGLASLTDGVSRCFEGGPVLQTCVEMDEGFLFVMAMGDSACLTVLAAAECEMGQLAYEMTTLVERLGKRLTPELRAHLAGTMRQ